MLKDSELKLELEREILTMIDEQMKLVQNIIDWRNKHGKQHPLYDIIEKRYEVLLFRIEQLHEEHKVLVNFKTEITEEIKSE